MRRHTWLFTSLLLAACAQVDPTDPAPTTGTADQTPADAVADGAVAGGAAVGSVPAGRGTPPEISADGELLPPVLPPTESSPMPQEPEGNCNAEAAQRFVGQTADRSIVEQAVTATGAKGVRVIEHGMMVTMDFRPDRLNIHLDEQGKIVRISCG